MWTTTSGLRGKKLHLAITFTSVIGFSLFGYDQGLMSGIISGEQFTKEFPPLDIPDNASQSYSAHVSVLRGAVTACYELGCFSVPSSPLFGVKGLAAPPYWSLEVFL
jgi:hypothetical protein